MVKPNQKVLLFANEGQERESIIRLARMGLENIMALMKGGYDAWKAPRKDNSRRPEKKAATITVDELKKLDVHSLFFVDVRKPPEVEKMWLKGATTIPLNTLE
jgi:rhodanese-related sulfurtransferase